MDIFSGKITMQEKNPTDQMEGILPHGNPHTCAPYFQFRGSLHSFIVLVTHTEAWAAQDVIRICSLFQVEPSMSRWCRGYWQVFQFANVLSYRLVRNVREHEFESPSVFEPVFPREAAPQSPLPACHGVHLLLRGCHAWPDPASPMGYFKTQT